MHRSFKFIGIDFLNIQPNNFPPFIESSIDIDLQFTVVLLFIHKPSLEINPILNIHPSFLSPIDVDIGHRHDSLFCGEELQIEIQWHEFRDFRFLS